MTIRQEKRGGFTLIELSIVLIIVGIMTGMSMQMLGGYQEHRSYAESRQRLSTISQALALFFFMHGRLPCPAPIDADESSEHYGREGSCSGQTRVNATYVGPPEVSAGLILAAGNNNATIVSGRVPTRDLNIKDYTMNDDWDNPVIYAVTVTLTDAATYTQTGGAIFIADKYGHSVITPPGAAQYVLVSSGPDKDKLSLGHECVSGKLDYTNCSGTSHFITANIQLAQGPEYFDDIVDYAVWVMPPMTGR